MRRRLSGDLIGFINAFVVSGRICGVTRHTVEGVRMATTAQPTGRSVGTQNIGRWIVGGLLGLVLAALLLRIVLQAIQNPSLLAQQLLTGVSKGAILAIIALGYTLVYGIIE